MIRYLSKTVPAIVLIFLLYFPAHSQDTYIISGKVLDANKQPLPGTSVQLKGATGGTTTNSNGSFTIATDKWSDTLELTHTGFEKLKYGLHKGQLTGLKLEMIAHISQLNDVIININTADKEPGKRFMKKVIANKKYNNPDRFSSYSYRQYKRHELDINNLDSAIVNNKGLKNLALNIYRSTDSANAKSPLLPLYFSETISDNYHQLSPSTENETVLAKKTLGLETDKVLRRLDKFSFSFNIYDNWLQVFNESYASPLSSSAFEYYNFYFSDSSMLNGHKLYKIHFSPKQKFERAFTGLLWINDSTYSIQKIDMRLSMTANLNFINGIHYTQEYALTMDSDTHKYQYMPYKYSSVIDFETGLALLGIPVKSKPQSVKLEASNTVVIDHVKVNTKVPDGEMNTKINEEATLQTEKDDNYWKQNRSDSLSFHEKSIYLMSDSMKNNRKYKTQTKIITAITTDYWDFGTRFRFGPFSSVMSTSINEGIRSRLGFWTLPGFNKKFNVHGYVAYGVKDKKVKGQLGVQYLWNALKWSKTSLTAGSDYDYKIENDDDLDEDNLLSSLIRKNIPSAEIFEKSVTLKQEQALSKNLFLKASLDYRVLNPAFKFSYHPIDKITELPVDSLYSSRLPVATASIGLRYTKNEQTKIFNYGLIRLDHYTPVFTLNYSYGIEAGPSRFTVQKLNAGVEQKLKLPPKAIFYYHLNIGKTFGTAPYLLLDIPGGNEGHADSRYLFNTMLPYEFVSDQFVNLHTTLYTGGMILDKIPYLNRMGMRERFSFNMHMGSLSDANKTYNNNVLYKVTGNNPFMEAGAGIENIFHFLSVDYYWRLSNTPAGTSKGGLYFGLKFAF